MTSPNPHPPSNGRLPSPPARSSSTNQETIPPPSAPISQPISISGVSDQIPQHLAPISLRIVLTGLSLGLLIGITLLNSFQLFSVSSFQEVRENGWYSKGWMEFIASNHVEGTGRVEGFFQVVKSSTHSILKNTWFEGKWEMVLENWRIENPLMRPQFNAYLLSWSGFHLLEFVITARYNPSRLHVDSFLLQNGILYHIAHLLGILEFLITSSLKPTTKNLSYSTYLGLTILIIGQIIRSLAMIHANNNFSHTVAWKKRDDHLLVTSGVYSLTRHPSYVGFFYWALSTQLLLSNPLSFFIFLVILWRFFNHRIRIEEIYLVEFFGKEYEEYRSKVWSGLVFIR